MKIATIGCGRMGARSSGPMVQYAPKHLQLLSHLGAARALPDLTQLGAADVCMDAVLQAKHDFNLDYVASDYKELIDSFQPDILTIATRTPEKKEILEYAIRSGIKTFHVEKPLCNSTSELDELEKLVSDEDILLTSGCLRRFLTPFQEALRYFENDELSSLRSVEVAMGRAALMWTQFHAIDLILFYAGKRKLEWVQANLGEVQYMSDVDIMTIENDPKIISATLQFEDGFTGHIIQNIGNTVRLTNSEEILELFADGRSKTLVNRTAPDDPYLTQHPTDVESGVLSGTQAPLQYLSSARLGDSAALDFVQKCKADFLDSQKVLFKLIVSDHNDGKREEFKTALDQISILGKSYGNFA